MSRGSGSCTSHILSAVATTWLSVQSDCERKEWMTNNVGGEQWKDKNLDVKVVADARCIESAHESLGRRV